MIRFLHYFGFALWMGGGWATMALVVKSRKETAATRVGLFRLLPASFGVMAGGAAITVLSGVALAMRLSRLGLGARLGEPGLILMQAAGLLGAVMVLALGAPTARKLAKLAAIEPLPPEFERLRKRQAAVSSVAGVLGLLALVGATLM
ncbi:MAG: hypothetical protein HY700_16760 [Gemmatimonadetes bacterium]|nr:hypothetical protein [Gemmatimonadota bacterium]